MTRVSLKEAYDNKDVVAQIYAIRDTAESAEDSAEQAVTTANTASDHVDALVPQVEGAVQNANSASASAQASAQTVAGYENRLATVETDLGQTESDLNAVALRVTTAEGDIITIQGRVTALETADGQNVKINRINDYAVGLTGNQETILGRKKFELLMSDNLVRSKYYSLASGGGNSANPWRLIYKMTSPVGSNTNTFLTFVYSGSRSGANSGQKPAILTVLGYGSNVQASGVGDSAPTCVKIIKESDGKIWVFGRCDNNNSGSGSCCFNVIGMRNDTNWEIVETATLCSISDGVAVDSNGVTVVSGTEVSVVI